MTSSLKQLIEVARERFAFKEKRQTDCGNQRLLITSTLKQLVEVAREKFAFKEEDKLILILEEQETEDQDEDLLSITGKEHYSESNCFEVLSHVLSRSFGSDFLCFPVGS